MADCRFRLLLVSLVAVEGVVMRRIRTCNRVPLVFRGKVTRVVMARAQALLGVPAAAAAAGLALRVRMVQEERLERAARVPVQLSAVPRSHAGVVVGVEVGAAHLGRVDPVVVVLAAAQRLRGARIRAAEVAVEMARNRRLSLRAPLGVPVLLS